MFLCSSSIRLLYANKPEVICGNRLRYNSNVHRRAFLASSAVAALAVACRGNKLDDPTRSRHPVRVAVDTRHRLAPIARDFLGLGYEISSVAFPACSALATAPMCNCCERYRPQA